MLAINFHPFPELSTSRLRFRQLKPGDAESIFKLRSDERVNRFLARQKCKTVEEAAAFIDKINRNISNNESMYWGIDLKDGDTLVGTICLWNIQPDNYRAEIGYELQPEFWGKGIMVEALAKVIEYAFETLKLHTLQADTDPANAQSAHVLERNGFVKEGHFKECDFTKGKFTDRAVYSIINSTD